MACLVGIHIVEGIVVVNAVDFDEDITVLHSLDLVVVAVVDAVGQQSNWVCNSHPLA